MCVCGWVGVLTGLDDVGELLADGHHEDFHPEILARILVEAEGPAAAVDVSRVFPDGLDAALEEVDRVFVLEAVEREQIEGFPKGLQGDDVLEHEGQTTFVVVGVGVFVVVE